MDYSTWQMISGTTGLIIFVVLFAGVLVYALWPSNKSTFDHAARLPLDDDPDVAVEAFGKLRELRDELAARYSCPLPELSMGMTGDLESAIAAGSTQIRVGTALYGARDV